MHSAFTNTSHLLEPNVSLVACILHGSGSLVCNGTAYELAREILGPGSGQFWMYLGIYVALVLAAGVMAGLILAIMSIDLTSLKVLIAAGTPENKKYAHRMAPFVKRQHMVLVTLVLANAAAMESMPIFLDRISDPVTAVLVSSTAVLIFGEVLPQAICSRHGLAIGYYMSWLVWALMGLFFPIAWPFGNLLDLVLGRDRGTFYRRKELQALVDIHGGSRKNDLEGGGGKKQEKLWCIGGKELNHSKESIDTERLTYDEVVIIKGALEMSSKKAHHAMVPLPDVYMLSVDSILDETLVREIFEMGHSRIPVYVGDRQRVLGVFLTKRLITIDPKQAIPLKRLIEDNPAGKTFYPTFCVDQDMPLYELLNRFQLGIMTHMAFVTAGKEEKDTPTMVGIVTMEDVIEELLQEEIYDEADVSRSNMSRRLQIAKAKMMLNKKFSQVAVPSANGSIGLPADFFRRQSEPVLDTSTPPVNGTVPVGSSKPRRKRSPSAGGVLNMVFEE